MNTNTRAFLNLLFEEKEEKQNKKEEKQNKKEADKSKNNQLPIYDVATSNQISKGRPISDPGLANIRSRAEQGSSEAKSLLSDLELSKPAGQDWYEQIQSLFNNARNTVLDRLIIGARTVRNKSGLEGVVVKLQPQWKDDDAGGKKSYGFIRSLVIASVSSERICAVSSVAVLNAAFLAFLSLSFSTNRSAVNL